MTVEVELRAPLIGIGKCRGNDPCRYSWSLLIVSPAIPDRDGDPHGQSPLFINQHSPKFFTVQQEALDFARKVAETLGFNVREVT